MYCKMYCLPFITVNSNCGPLWIADSIMPTAWKKMDPLVVVNIVDHTCRTIGLQSLVQWDYPPASLVGVMVDSRQNVEWSHSWLWQWTLQLLKKLSKAKVIMCEEGQGQHHVHRFQRVVSAGATHCKNLFYLMSRA